jgi:hypothetical protein
MIDILNEPLKNCNIFLLVAEEYEFCPNALVDIFSEDIKNRLKEHNNQIYFLFGGSNIDAYADTSTRYNYHQPENNMYTIIWPTFWLNRTLSANINSNINFFLNKQKKDFKKEKILYPYICMNNVGKPHRCLMIDLLAKNNLLDNGAISWRNFCVDTSYKWKYTDSKLRTLSDFKKYNIKTYDVQFTPPTEFYKSFMSVITETTTDINFITEKTATALLFKQPFLVQGAKGFHENLKSLGFKLYDEIFDYDFDQEPDFEKRTQMIIDNIKKISNQDFNTMYKELKPKLDFNYKRMIEIVRDQLYIPELLKDNKIFQDYYNSEIFQIDDEEHSPFLWLTQ